MTFVPLQDNGSTVEKEECPRWVDFVEKLRCSALSIARDRALESFRLYPVARGCDIGTFCMARK